MHKGVYWSNMPEAGEDDMRPLLDLTKEYGLVLGRRRREGRLPDRRLEGA